jgi:hypothetical protein
MESPLPAGVAQILAKTPDGGVEVCPSANSPSGARYLLYTAIKKGASDVCFYEKKAVFPESGTAAWTFTPPAGREYLATSFFMMRISKEKCSSWTEAGYVQTDGVSGGVFTKIINFWQKITSSPEVFTSATASLPNELLALPVFKEFEQQFKASHALMRVSSLTLVAYSGVLPFYSLSIQGGGKAWTLNVDVLGDEVLIIGLGSRSN